MFTELLRTVTMAIVIAAPEGEIDSIYDRPNVDFVPAVLRWNEQEELDNSRRTRYEKFNVELDELWRKYRADGSTAAGRKAYEAAVRRIRRKYVERDPLYVPVYNR